MGPPSSPCSGCIPYPVCPPVGCQSRVERAAPQRPNVTRFRMADMAYWPGPAAAVLWKVQGPPSRQLIWRKPVQWEDFPGIGPFARQVGGIQRVVLPQIDHALMTTSPCASMMRIRLRGARPDPVEGDRPVAVDPVGIIHRRERRQGHIQSAPGGASPGTRSVCPRQSGWVAQAISLGQRPAVGAVALRDTVERIVGLHRIGQHPVRAGYSPASSWESPSPGHAGPGYPEPPAAAGSG